MLGLLEETLRVESFGASYLPKFPTTKVVTSVVDSSPPLVSAFGRMHARSLEEFLMPFPCFMRRRLSLLVCRVEFRRRK